MGISVSIHSSESDSQSLLSTTVIGRQVQVLSEHSVQGSSSDFTLKIPLVCIEREAIISCFSGLNPVRMHQTPFRNEQCSESDWQIWGKEGEWNNIAVNGDLVTETDAKASTLQPRPPTAR